jgi:glycosyltransferase involved in cell wall biosynthesis
MIKALSYSCAILALNTVFNQEMLQDGKFGLFLKKELFSITNMIDYCEKENILVNKLRSESINGITEKYDWDFVTSQYLKVFKTLVSKRN